MKPRSLVSVPWTLYATSFRGWREIGGVLMPSFTFGKRTSKSNPWEITLVIPKNIKDMFAANLLEAMQKNRNEWPGIELHSTHLMKFEAKESSQIVVSVKGRYGGYIAAFESR